MEIPARNRGSRSDLVILVIFFISGAARFTMTMPQLNAANILFFSKKKGGDLGLDGPNIPIQKDSLLLVMFFY